MDCRIELSDGSVINIPNVDDSWTWFDLMETLYDLGEISGTQRDDIGRAVNLDDPVERKLSLHQSQPPTGSLDQRRRLGDHVGHTRLRRKTGFGILPPQPADNRPKINPIPSKGGLKRKIEPIEPAIVTNFTYTMPMKCSRNSADWVAILISEHKPVKSKNKTSKSTAEFAKGIHLVLDDSGSMSGEPMSQLKSAATSFLAERPAKEHIHLHTFNNTLSGSGPPSTISNIVRRLTTPGKTPMCACLRRVSISVSSGDVIIFFTDGGSTDGNPTSIATSIKNAGVRFISIGCGSQADSGLLMGMASSKTDYHHARSASGILKAFQAVAKSLGQQHIALSTVGKKSGSNIIARQVQTRGSATPSSLPGTTSGPTVLADNEGFEFIEEFKCHHCSSIERIACANCGKNTCSGGASHSKTGNSKIKCPFCNEYSEIEITKKGVLGRIGRNGGKGKKGV